MSVLQEATIRYHELDYSQDIFNDGPQNISTLKEAQIITDRTPDIEWCFS